MKGYLTIENIQKIVGRRFVDESDREWKVFDYAKLPRMYGFQLENTETGVRVWYWLNRHELNKSGSWPFNSTYAWEDHNGVNMNYVVTADWFSDMDNVLHCLSSLILKQIDNYFTKS